MAQGHRAQAAFAGGEGAWGAPHWPVFVNQIALHQPRPSILCTHGASNTGAHAISGRLRFMCTSPQGLVIFIGCQLLGSNVALSPGLGADRMVKKEFRRGCTRMHADEIRTRDLSGRIIGCAFRVQNMLGAGFLEKVYENAAAYEIRAAGLAVALQKGITVYYDGIVVGEDVADLVVEDAVAVELKASKALDPAHTVQCTNYLTATGLQLCLLLNFARPRLEIHRIAHEL